MNERKELFRLANIALAITIPILVVGGVVLRDANEAIQQGFALLAFLLCVGIFFILDERNQRRRRGQ